MPLSILDAWNREIVECRKCPRLVEWRERVAKEERKSFIEDDYWGRPVPYFGDPDGDLLIVGLAPAAHGANRTGRMFTGDRSGDWLYRALHKAGIANQPQSVSAGDGLSLSRAMIAAVCHCAPPDNKPLPEEIGNCAIFLERVIHSRQWRAILCLGGIAWLNTHRILNAKPTKFAHLAMNQVDGTLIVGSYHPSQQNTFTGRLTEPMLDEAIRRWRDA